MWITKSQFLFLAILSLFYPIFLNFHGDFRYGFPLSSSSQYKLFPHALGRLELSPTQIAVVHFPIKGMFLQNQIWLSADHQTLLVMEQNKDWWVPKHQDRQKNALVDHDRSRWLRGPGGLCVAVYRTSSKWNAQSEVLAKQIAVQQHWTSLDDIFALCCCCCDPIHYLVALYPEIHHKLGENIISI